MSPSEQGHDGDTEMRLVLAASALAVVAVGEGLGGAPFVSSSAWPAHGRAAPWGDGFRRTALSSARNAIRRNQNDRSRCRPATPQRHCRIAGAPRSSPSVGRDGSSTLALARNTLNETNRPATARLSIWCGT